LLWDYGSRQLRSRALKRYQTRLGPIATNFAPSCRPLVLILVVVLTHALL
jgi:hypothetical protein